MAASFKKTSIRLYPRIGEKITRDTLYWKNLEFPVVKKEYGAVTSIDFSPVEPYNYAVTNSSRVQVYSHRSNQVIKTLSVFRETAYGASFRSDGKLLTAAGEEGHVRLFDVDQKAQLRVFKGHSGPCHVSRFTNDGLHIVSGGDDRTAKLWDIATEAEVASYQDHQDYVRCGVTSKASNDIFVTGSYDHTVKVYDARTSCSVLTVEHGQPVESLLLFPGGGVILSAGGSVIKVWDMLAGGRLLAAFSNHHKTITSLAFCSNYQRLLSASIDRHVKVYDVTTYQVVHTLDYPSAILSVAVAPDDSTLTVGMADGLLSIQHRKQEEDIAAVQKEKKMKKASYRYQLQVKNYVPSQDAHVVEHRKKDLMAKYDKYLRKFEHSKALDAALDLRVRMKTPEVTVSVMQELIRRGGIKAALAGRDDKSLSIIIMFLQKNISNPKYMSTLLDIANMVVDLYTPQVGQSSDIDELFRRLKETIDQEASYMKSMMEVMGTMDSLFAASQQHQDSAHSMSVPSTSVPMGHVS